MILIMQVGVTKAQVAAVVANIEAMGLNAHVIEGQERTVVAVVGDDRSAMDRDALASMSGVERMAPVLAPYKIASREVHPANTLVSFNGSVVGDKKIVVIAGPPAIESREQTLRIAEALKEAGADALCGNVFGNKTSPYGSKGPGEKGLQALAEARKLTGLPIVTEVNDPESVPTIGQYADVLQISGQNMQNYPLLNAVGKAQHSVLVKRGVVNTMEELLMAAEYILSHSNRSVMLCEGGIRTPEAYTQNTTFDVNAVAVLKHKSHLPVIVDASRAVGGREFVAAAAKAAVASGADGLIIDVEDDHEETVGDTDHGRSLNIGDFAILMKDLRRLATAIDRTI